MKSEQTGHYPFFQRHLIVFWGLLISFTGTVLLTLFDTFSFGCPLIIYFFIVFLADFFKIGQKETLIDPEKLLFEQGVGVEDFNRYIVSKKIWRYTTFMCGLTSGSLAILLGHSFPLYMGMGCFALWCLYPIARIFLFKIPNPQFKLSSYLQPQTDTNICRDWMNQPSQYTSTTDPTGPYRNTPGTFAYNLTHPYWISRSFDDTHYINYPLA